MMRSWMNWPAVLSEPTTTTTSSSFSSFMPVSSSLQDDDWVIVSHVITGGETGARRRSKNKTTEMFSSSGNSSKEGEAAAILTTLASLTSKPLSTLTTAMPAWRPTISSASLANWKDSFAQRSVDQLCDFLIPSVRDLFWLGLGAFAVRLSPFQPNFWQHWRLSRLPHASAGHCYKENPLPIYKRAIWWMVPQLGHWMWGKNTSSVLRVDRVLHRKGFSLGYCFAQRCALWSSFILTPSGCRLSAAPESSGNGRFVADKMIPPRYRIDPKLFKSNLGFDRGHLAPKASVGFSTQAADDSFYFSNVILQDATLNRGVWRDLEFLTRYWATSKDTSLAVCVGPVFESDTQGARFVHYNASGNPEISKKKVTNHQTNNKVFNHLLEKLDAAHNNTLTTGLLHATPARLAPFVNGGGSETGSQGNGDAANTLEQEAQQRLSKAETAVRVPDFLFMAVQDLSTGNSVGFLLPNTTTREQNQLKGEAQQSVGPKSKTAAGAKYQKYLRKQMLSMDELEQSIRTLNGSKSFSLFNQLDGKFKVSPQSELRKKVDHSFWTFD